MPVPAPTQTALVNAGFEDGTTTGWTIVQSGGTGTPTASTERPYTGSYSGLWTGASGSGYAGGVEAVWTNTAEGTVKEGQSVTASARIALKDTGSSQNRGEVRLYWYNAGGTVIAYTPGNLIRGNNSSYRLSTVTAVAPANAQFVRVAVWTTANSSGGILFDDVTWNYVYNQTVTIDNPEDNDTFLVGENIQYRVTFGGTTPVPESVTYKADGNVIGTTTNSPFNLNNATLVAGNYDITAEVTFDDDTLITTDAIQIDIGVTPTTREFKASNAYTYLVAQDFAKLASAMPSVAKVTAVELIVDYGLALLVRAKDLEIDDPEDANPDVLFDMLDGATLSAVLMEDDGTTFTPVGTPLTQKIPLVRTDFDLTEEGTSEGKKWVFYTTAADATVTLGSEDDFFGLDPIQAADFIERSVGFRLTPNILSKPDYADSGDACIRFFLDKLRMRVYFDGGSVLYYFASPDKTDVIEGTLVASYVDDGAFANKDAEGTLQLAPTLTVLDGDQTWIGADWTIHAAYPPTDANQIGDVTPIRDGSAVGMGYNGLPSYTAVTDNRSRYEFITTNFYGDRDLNSIYGVNGYGRAFAFNGDSFYKIQTTPEDEKDKPRHVANHQSHLALGFEDGRVDISVIGQPYNYDGSLGASSWATGDKVHGLLPLTGTILGIFGSKSIWGISGTTVDNFATQVISPNIGAVEYTVTDMGQPVYANAYGIYTLSQTQQYGDYLGSPMSQDISPWLRPRLVRKITSDKEAVVAWPVRSKNQYRLAFSDGYVLSMTLNGQTIPTFSFQKYYIY